MLHVPESAQCSKDSIQCVVAADAEELMLSSDRERRKCARRARNHSIYNRAPLADGGSRLRVLLIRVAGHTLKSQSGGSQAGEDFES